jgi:erythronate-4-phosphate dehydrogenase
MSSKIQLLADSKILIHKNYIPGEVELHTYEPSDGIPQTVHEYDALLVRTVNPLDRTTISNKTTNLKFAGSATAGIDHVDQEWLKELGITFAHSPGCNASSVGEYVAVAVLEWSLRTETDLSGMSAGIIGAGNTGGAAKKLLSRLSVQCLLYDPPKEKTEPGFQSVSLEEVLNCDILTFHTPLTHSGHWPTYHWLNSNKLKDRSYQLIINASRGGVVDEKALTDYHQQGIVRDYVLDVWENEPVFNDSAAGNAFIRTPHIAGYSIQSKQRATHIVMKSLCDFFGIDSEEFTFTPPFPPAPVIPASASEKKLLELLNELNPIHEYDQRFSSLIGQSSEQKKRRFQRIRTGFPLRHEHPCYKVHDKVLKKYPVLGSLGFGVK